MKEFFTKFLESINTFGSKFCAKVRVYLYKNIENMIIRIVILLYNMGKIYSKITESITCILFDKKTNIIKSIICIENNSKIDSNKNNILERYHKLNNNKRRFILTRNIKDNNNKVLVCILHNPSIANSKKNDPTTTKLEKIGKYNDYGKLILVNLWSIRTSKAKELKKNIDYINIELIKFVIKHYSNILLAYGNNVKLPIYIQKFLKPYLAEKKSLYYLKLSINKIPYHPYSRGKYWLKDTIKLKKIKNLSEISLQKQ